MVGTAGSPAMCMEVGAHGVEYAGVHVYKFLSNHCKQGHACSDMPSVR